MKRLVRAAQLQTCRSMSGLGNGCPSGGTPAGEPESNYASASRRMSPKVNPLSSSGSCRGQRSDSGHHHVRDRASVSVLGWLNRDADHQERPVAQDERNRPLRGRRRRMEGSPPPEYRTRRCGYLAMRRRDPVQGGSGPAPRSGAGVEGVSGDTRLRLAIMIAGIAGCPSVFAGWLFGH